jgi:hypothetical protein
MSNATVPMKRPGMVGLRELSAEEQAQHAQNDATARIKRLEEDLESLRNDYRHLVDVVNSLAEEVQVRR